MPHTVKQQMDQDGADPAGRDRSTAPARSATKKSRAPRKAATVKKRAKVSGGGKSLESHDPEKGQAAVLAEAEAEAEAGSDSVDAGPGEHRVSVNGSLPTPRETDAALRRALSLHLPLEDLVLAIREGLGATKPESRSGSGSRNGTGREPEAKDGNIKEGRERKGEGGSGKGVPDYSIRERYIRLGLEYQVGKSIAREQVTFRRELDLRELEQKCRKPAFRAAMRKLLDRFEEEEER